MDKWFYHNLICPHLELVDISRCMQVSHEWYDIFRANAALCHIKDRICRAVPALGKYYKKDMSIAYFLKVIVYPYSDYIWLSRSLDIDIIVEILHLIPELSNLKINHFNHPMGNSKFIEFYSNETSVAVVFIIPPDIPRLYIAEHFIGNINSKICKSENNRARVSYFDRITNGGNLILNLLFSRNLPIPIFKYRPTEIF